MVQPAALPTRPLPLTSVCCRYLHWLQQGVTPGEAYLERAAVHCGAKCYLQGRADAQAAVAALRAALQQQRQQGQGEAGGGATGQQAGAPTHAGHAEQQAGGEGPAGGGSDPSSPASLRCHLALAYQRLGQAFMAEKEHADRAPARAAKAFLRAQELDSELEGLLDEVQDAVGELTLEESRQVGGAWGERGLGTCTAVVDGGGGG